MKRIILAFVIIVLEISGIIYYNTRYLDSKSNINFNIEDEAIVLQVNTPYTQEIPKAIFRDTDITDKVKITNNLNINKIGKYEIVYKVKYKNKSIKRVKTIYIVDNIKPVITLNGDSEIDLYLNQAYNEQGAIATDNYDGDISDKIKVESNLDTTKEGTYNITYTVSDSSFNTVSIERKVNVKKRPVRTGVAVLNYHFFYDDNESNCTMGNCISTSKFEQHLKYLKDNGFKTLSMKEFKEWMNVFGVEYGEEAESSKNELSALQQGIQSVSEPTANAIEAYMNGVSQQVYYQSDLLTQIRDAVVGFNLDVQVASMSQILLQLRSSYEMQTAIHSMLEGWSSPNGMSVRVEMI